MAIPNVERQVPMMFRAQVEHRSQPQRLDPERGKREEPQDAQFWVDQWTERIDAEGPITTDGVQNREYQVSWRFVTNGGQDDGIIRPVIGAGGWPFYPGSSMKGLFRSACTPEQAERYCGRGLPAHDFTPGLLRFHGAYPTDDRWTEGLLDLVHPQQKRQVGMDDRPSSAFAMISLREPKLRFGISSTQPLSAEEWDTIWGIWETALDRGIGSRVCAGYGRIAGLRPRGDVLWKGTLKGQGPAAKLLNGQGEFRPNSFRAAVRGHALRIFGGLTSEGAALRAVDELFGSVKGHGEVGLLAMAFNPRRDPVIGHFGEGSWQQPTYDVEGEFAWLLTRPLDSDKRADLKKLITKLTSFTLLLGGIGKSWRRADHSLFYPQYKKTPIGCHWQWGEDSRRFGASVCTPQHVGPFLDSVREITRLWLTQQGHSDNGSASWRETWSPGNVQIWAWAADSEEDCYAAEWFHQDYATGKSIKKTILTGGNLHNQDGLKIGHIWHRMYPVIKTEANTENHGKPKFSATSRYLEILTIFKHESDIYREFIEFLESEKIFKKVWGGTELQTTPKTSNTN